MVKTKRLLLCFLLSSLIVFLGVASNRVVSLLNNGMPLPSVYSYPPAQLGKWVPIYEETKLMILADIIPTPFGYSSVGDFLIIFGFICLFIITLLFFKRIFQEVRVRE